MAKNPKPDDAAPESLSFEDALERLETIVEELEGGELSLEQSLRHYEEGMKLSKRLTKTLDEAEKTIERLVEAGDDEPESTATAPGAAPRRGRKPATRPMELPLGGGAAGDDETPF